MAKYFVILIFLSFIATRLRRIRARDSTRALAARVGENGHRVLTQRLRFVLLPFQHWRAWWTPAGKRSVGPALGAIAMAALGCVGVTIVMAGSPLAGNITMQRLLHSDTEPGEWMTGGRDYKQSYYSPLEQINAANVANLGFAWNRDIGPANSLRGTPIVVDGVMYLSGAAKVFALDASDGKILWSFAAPGSEDSGGASRDGISVANGKVYLITGEGIFYAVDAANGSLVWKVDTIADRSRSYAGAGVPCIAGDVVVVGNAGGEFDARGYVTAYDLATGIRRWRFYTVPGNPKKGFEHPELMKAAKSWDPNSRWDLGGGGTVWSGMTYDPELKLIYVGTGNGNPWSRSLRSPSGGDNLFIASIVAIHADTGAMAWYYQNTPADNWDYDAVEKIVLADIRIDGRMRKVLFHAPKNGFFYVIDRETGELLSAKPYVYVNWAKEVDVKTGKPRETVDGDYSKTPKLVFPGDWGGHNWQPMSFNPATGLVYIPTLESATIYGPSKEPLVHHKGQWNIGITFLRSDQMKDESLLPKGWPPLKELLAGKPDPAPRTYLRAWDPVRQSKIWEVETTNSPLTASGNLSGVISTAGSLVIQGEADGHLRIFDARDGRELRNITTGLTMRAAPITYRAAGEQYIALLATAGSQGKETTGDPSGEVVVFKLNGSEVPRSLMVSEAANAPPVPNLGTRAQIKHGGELYASNCSVCHSSESRAPDLSRLSAASHHDFMHIVLEGTRATKGMPNFGSTLSEDDAKALHAYVTDLAWKNYASQAQPASK